MEVHLLVRNLNVIEIVEHDAVIRFERRVDQYLGTIVNSLYVSSMGEDLVIHFVDAVGGCSPRLATDGEGLPRVEESIHRFHHLFVGGLQEGM